MKLSEYAKRYGITYRTAFRWWQQGQIKGFQKPSGTIIVTEGEEETPLATKVVAPVVIYARVSSPKQKAWNDKLLGSKTTVQPKAIKWVGWSKRLVLGSMTVAGKSFRCSPIPESRRL